MSTSAAGSKHTNRLARESSPYLLQHAHNPVDWYAWGPEAFEKARREDKPIFLSVGYSTCYWCHVMERQSFENEAVAAEMNRLFVNIKVDREERPDVDQLYMTAVQLLTRHGGWPMSVWLTPDLRPFYGGTYFPPTDQYGRPGFVTLLRALEDAYRNRRDEVEKSADQIVQILRQLARPSSPEAPITIDLPFIESLVDRSVSDYEPEFGGFGGAPKFPRETLLELLLVYLDSSVPQSQIANRKSQIRAQLDHTLSGMADGGIHDHLGGGFHRYSTDAQWLVPHFEIMLYDNAMLAWVYVEAYRQTKDHRWATVGRGIFDFVLREMTSPDGGFYTAFDAEVDAMEGASYLWTADEIESVLGADDARLFNRVYGVDRGPNFADPHHGTGRPDKNILYLPQPLPTVAQELKLDEEQLERRLEPMRQKLYETRRKRKQPLLDTKIITSWNALMIRALAHGGAVLGEARYSSAAARAAEFLLHRHRTSDGGLYRTSRDGNPKHDAFLDDYAFLVQALLGFNEDRWKREAIELTRQMLDRFGDREGGGFYFTQENAADLIVRQKTAQDSPLPSGNAIAVMALLDLDMQKEARGTAAAFAAQLERQAEAMSSMIQAALQYVRRHGPLTVSPGAGASAADRPLSPQQAARGIASAAAHWAGPTELHVRLNILRGFHINAHEIGSDLPLIPTTLTVQDMPDAAVEYPPGEELRAAFVDEPICVYSGEANVVIRFASPPHLPLRLSLSYQACDETACLPPVTKTIEVR